MFEGKDLDALAKRAKEQLASQVQGDEGLAKPGEDIYADFREKSVNPDTISAQPDIKILNKPQDPQANYAIQNTPDSSYYEQEPPKITPYDEELFPGGPTVTQVESWKKQWDGYEVCLTEVCDQYFVFRTLNRFEYKQIVALKNVDPLQREEIICETCVLWPQPYKWDNMATDKAGIPSTLSQILMERSGFSKEYSIQVL